MSNQQTEKSPSSQDVEGLRNEEESQHTEEVQSEQRLQAGERLRLAREARGLSMADVAAWLKLDEGKIRALEQGDISDLATPVFVAGYLRTYARLLELPEEEVIADYHGLTEALAAEQVSAVGQLQPENEIQGTGVSTSLPKLSFASESGLRPVAVVGIIGLLLLGIYLLWLGNTGEQSAVESLPVAIGTADLAADTARDTAKEVEPAQPALPETVKNTPEADVLETGVSAGTAGTERELVVPPKVETANHAEEQIVAGPMSELSLSFTDDSWVEVKDARGERLVYRLGKAGTTRVVKGVAPFDVQLGYVRGVDILYNGSPYDLSRYAGRRSIRLRIGAAGDQLNNG